MAFRLLILILAISSHFDAHSASPVAANDNNQFPTKCELLLLENHSKTLVEADGEKLFDGGHQLVMDKYEAELQRLALTDRAAFQALSAVETNEINALPAVTVSEDGFIVEKWVLQSGDVKLVVRNGANSELVRSVEVAARDWLPLGKVAPGAGYVSVASRGSRQLKVISLRTGKVILDNHATDPSMGVTITFSGPENFTINNDGQIANYAVENGHAKFTSGHSLGSNPVNMAEGKLGTPLFVDAIGAVYHLPEMNAYAAFYLGPEPLLLKLGEDSTFSRLFFEPAKEGFRPRTDYSQTPAGLEGLAAQIAKPTYRNDGLVSVRHDRLIAVRVQGGERPLSMVDVFSLSRRNVIRTFATPKVPYEMALSPSGRFLAISGTGNGGVRIYDLKGGTGRPHVLIKFDDKYGGLLEGGLLAFANEKTLLAGSINAAKLFRFKLP